MNTGGIGNEHQVGKINKKAAFNDSRDSLYLFFQAPGVVDNSEAAVENAVTTISHEWLARRREAQARGRAELLETCFGYLHSKLNDLYRNRYALTQLIDQLAAVHDNRATAARSGNDLLAQQRSPKPFDEVERGPFYLVGAVNRKIDFAMLAERSKRNLRCRRLGSCALGRGNANETQPLLMPPGKRFDCKRCGRARPEPDYHSILHQLDCCFGGCAFQSISVSTGFGG
jgi:hypothetical protein